MSSKSSVVNPARGEIWQVDLDPTIGREQAGRRPALIVSVNELNSGPRGLAVVIPVTGTIRGLPTHISIDPPEGGLTDPSAIMVEQVRSISRHRFSHRRGAVTPRTMAQVEEVMRIVLGL